MGFKEYEKLELPSISEEILAFWEKESVFEKSVDFRNKGPHFIFYEGPPSANGIPGIHHVMARTIKDIFCRFKTQKGFHVDRKAGWDTHGLPVELEVEKELGITKDSIGKTITIKDYNIACKNTVMRYTGLWNDLTKKIGYWVDIKNPYVTYESKYMESVWWLIKQIYNKGLLYKGYSVQPYSPKAGTGISSHELNQPGTYKDVSDTSITAMFKVINTTLPPSINKNENIYFLAWTTTPWTLPSNTALIVGSQIKYSIIKTFNQYTFLPIRIIIATSLIAKQFGGKFEKVKEIKELNNYTPKDKKIPFYIDSEHFGEELIGIRYEKIWKSSPQPISNPENAFRVISANFVTTDEGTGIVHAAPTFGADDAKAAKQAVPEIPPLLVLDEKDQHVPLVDLNGKFRKELGSLGGKYVKNEYYEKNQIPEYSVDVEIAIKLKKENLAFKVEKHVHSYPNCWRTDKPLLYYPLNSWFIKVSDVRKRMVDLNNKINWKPESTGEGRFGNWVSNANDWNLSRSRFWGIPLPIWCSEDRSIIKVIGSVKELINEILLSVNSGFAKENPFEGFIIDEMSDENYKKIDLHKNVVDSIILVSDDKKTPLYRENDLIDVWFDSGSMPYAQWHYPFENKEKIDDKIAFPADYIAEGVDQTRGWFYTLHTISTIVFNNLSYKNVISNGLVLDKKGHKMSKRLGNAVDPFDTINNFGPDATRWYMISNSNPWDNLKFDINGIAEVQRKFFGTLYNTYSFFSLYANIDGFSPDEKQILITKRDELDNWILSELNTLIKDVENSYENYEPTKAARFISDFVQEKLSNWYVRLSRRKFWKGAYGNEKLAAYQTLYECLITLTKLAAPIAPFYMDHLYIDLTKSSKEKLPISVHLTDFPVANESLINLALQKRINSARTISSLALSLRKKEQIKVRQPLRKLLVPVKSKKEITTIKLIEDQLKSEINVKEIEILDNTSALLIKEIRPNYKILGPKFGKELKNIGKAIQKMSSKQIQLLEDTGEFELIINKKSIKLARPDVEISSKDIEGWLVAYGDGHTVALDIRLDNNLIEEGIAREFVNRVQNQRKDIGLEVIDKIEIVIENDSVLYNVIKTYKDYIKNETLASSIKFADIVDGGIKLSFDKINSRVFIKKINE
ncbi:MAG: isoleucine--tRNA ligase [Flavobacteriaceae bacterium]|nr:isoleucine--tRNA ligase [Flavobacteriaceae bacterium]|tara:strand:- start:12371 stop:15781 length:3411 start_codon:yes stop_codon:yes gene_type:complete